ncbi:MAG: FISUMP domain-containing protein [Bacteroidales bacterium]
MNKINELNLTIIFFMVMIIAVGCKKGNTPTVTTTSASNITLATASSGGNVTDEGSSAVTSRGVCWSALGNPKIANDSITKDGAGAGSFTSVITGLKASTNYTIRAYATNSEGTGYGKAVTFETLGEAPIDTFLFVTNFDSLSVTLNGTVNPNYLSTVVTFEYGTTTSYGNTVTAAQSPVTGNTNTPVSADISGLTSSTLYHYRIEAVNSDGTKYSSDAEFTTDGTLTDVDGNKYRTITIGSQVWTAENLRTTKFSDGTPIQLVPDTTWKNLTSSAYCWNNNDSATACLDSLGALYTWYVVDITSNGVKNVCPTGWHVPSSTEWNTMITYLSGSYVAGGKLKEAGTSHWISPNTGATDESGFRALPANIRMADGTFGSPGGSFGYWWTSSEYDPLNAYFREVRFDVSTIYIGDYPKNSGLSIRCIQN